jgi:hypothetical protein
LVTKKRKEEKKMKFGFKNIGHFFAVVARDVVKAGAVASQLEAPIEAVTALVAGPAAVPALAIERAAFAAGGYIVQAAKDVNVEGVGPDATVSLSITMLASEVADFKALYAAFEAMAHKAGVTPASAAA